MMKSLRNSVLAVAVLLAASFSIKAQTVVVDEDFTSTTTWQPSGALSATNFLPFGYSAYTAGCESGNVKDTTITRSATYPTGTVDYTMLRTAINLGCGVKSTSNTAACPLSTDAGYAQVAKTAESALTTSEFDRINTVTIHYSTTDKPRGGVLEMSVNGGAWAKVDTFYSPCGTAGATRTFTLNQNNVAIRFKPSTETLNGLQIFRIHKLQINGVIGVNTAIKTTTWLESGVSLAVDNNNVLLTSEKASGSVDIVSLTGAVVAQKEIQKGIQTSFTVPTSGLYIVRFTSDNKVYTSKVAVK